MAFEIPERIYLRCTTTSNYVAENQDGVDRTMQLRTTHSFVDAKSWTKRATALAWLKKMREDRHVHGRYEVCDIVLI